MADAVAVIFQQRRCRRRKVHIRRVFNARISSIVVRDLDFVSRYRLDRVLFQNLLETVGQTLEKTYRGGHTIPPDTQSVRNRTGNTVYIGSCWSPVPRKRCLFSEVADTHGVSRSSVCRIIHGFVDDVINNVDNIKFPVQRDDQMSVKRGFYRKCKFPNIVLFSVDGTLVPILAPTANEESFVCRKGFHAINCQTVASSDLRFIDIVAKWPGPSHDAVSPIFNLFSLQYAMYYIYMYDYLEADLEAVLLGDSGYPLRRYLITPILHPSNENEERCLHRSGATSTPDHGHEEPRRKLVVEMPSKIKDVYQKKKDYRHRPSKKAVLIKWISTLLLFVLILGFINFSKVTNSFVVV
ncbi:LOW QUALITY PROTEIN: HARB1-like protein [Mya arenaria]|uniref:HARB1-like protein n=1 Tax=Mya arenaria TaxID=6604 RepID=A0ABY7G9N4_MYAAR|nr:LOW QUALITY PROTEIN: HARB1-like protein [Mya arenaria]